MKLSLPSRARFVRHLSLTKTQTLGNRESHKNSKQNQVSRTSAVSHGHTTRKISTCCLSNVNDKSYKQSALHIFSLSPWSNLISFWVNLTLSRWPLLAEVLHWHLSVVCKEVSRWRSLGNLHQRSLGFQIFPIFISDFDWNKQISSDKHWDFQIFQTCQSKSLEICLFQYTLW